MNHSRVVILLLLSLGLFSCTTGSDNASTVNAPTSTVNADEVVQLVNTTEESASSTPEPGSPDEVICRREQITGSNFRRRVCLTRAQRAEMRSGSRDQFIERKSATIGR